MFNFSKANKPKSSFKTMMDMATIISTSITCITLYIKGVINTNTAIYIILGAVIATAIGGKLAKLTLVLIAVFVFALYNSGGFNVGFYLLLKSLFALFLALLGIYYMIRSFFKSNK